MSDRGRIILKTKREETRLIGINTPLETPKNTKMNLKKLLFIYKL